jgi:hypothetical protein
LKLRFFSAVFPRETAFLANFRHQKQPHAGGQGRFFPGKTGF